MARGVVFGLVGVFFIEAGRYVDPSRVRGIDGALQYLAQQPAGPWLMAIVALGLVAFGLYSMMNALWFRMPR